MCSFQAGVENCAPFNPVKNAQTIDLMLNARYSKSVTCTQSIQVMMKIVLPDSGFYGVIYNITVATADTYETKNTLAISL
jgi:hypothetical protein